MQQRRRIRDKQSRSFAAQKNTQKSQDSLDALLSSDQLGPEQSGVVVTRYSNQADVLAEDAPQNPLRKCYFRSHLNSLVTGDKVTWRDGDPYGVISSVLPRESQLERPDSRGKIRTVVANISQIVITVAPEPEPHANLIDRYLVASEHHHIAALIILNKIDLHTKQVDKVTQLVAPYQSIGYPVLSVSATSGKGINELRSLLNNHTSVFVGQSGVGKSSLINSLCPSVSAKVGELSTAKTKGRHTTTTADLFPLPGGGSIIDSPGIREFGLLHLEQAQLASGFVEFRPFLGLCRYRNCQHRNEPNCALYNALLKGEISTQRLDSFRQISRSLGYK